MLQLAYAVNADRNVIHKLVSRAVEMHVYHGRYIAHTSMLCHLDGPHCLRIVCHCPAQRCDVTPVTWLTGTRRRVSRASRYGDDCLQWRHRRI